jgi:hypothetical protein
MEVGPLTAREVIQTTSENRSQSSVLEYARPRPRDVPKEPYSQESVTAMFERYFLGVLVGAVMPMIIAVKSREFGLVIVVAGGSGMLALLASTLVLFAIHCRDVLTRTGTLLLAPPQRAFFTGLAYIPIPTGLVMFVNGALSNWDVIEQLYLVLLILVLYPLISVLWRCQSSTARR